MNINISLIKKIDNIVKLSNDFDKIFNSMIKISNPSDINSEQIERSAIIILLKQISRIF